MACWGWPAALQCLSQVAPTGCQAVLGVLIIGDKLGQLLGPRYRLVENGHGSCGILVLGHEQSKVAQRPGVPFQKRAGRCRAGRGSPSAPVRAGTGSRPAPGDRRGRSCPGSPRPAPGEPGCHIVGTLRDQRAEGLDRLLGCWPPPRPACRRGRADGRSGAADEARPNRDS